MTNPHLHSGVIISPRPIFRYGVKELLALAGVQVWREETNAESGLATLRRLAPRLLVLDMKTPEREGEREHYLDARWIRKYQSGAAATAIVSLTDVDRYGLSAFENGAMAYLKKDCSLQEFHDAVFAALRGERYLGQAATSALIKRACSDGSAALPNYPFEGLPASLKPVLNDIISGFTPGEIAAKRHLSPGTLSRQRKQIREAMGVRTDVDLLRRAVEHGYHELG